MDEQAFTVLPPLSPRLPPPVPTPVPTRVAPRSLANKEATAFVILGEIKLSTNGSGNEIVQTENNKRRGTSPFRGSGFRTSSPNSKIPVLSGKSAPSSPVRKTTTIVDKTTTIDDKTTLARQKGKSAPSSPKKTIVKTRTSSYNKKVSSDDTKIEPPIIKEPTTNKRVNVKPSLPKTPRKTITRLTTNLPNVKPPIPTKRETKPAPAVRTRLNNKPTSTEFKPGSLSKDKSVDNQPPRAATRKTTAASTAVETNVAEKTVQSTEINDVVVVDNKNKVVDNKNKVVENKTDEPTVNTMLINVGDDDIVNKVVTVTETVPEIHKLNIEIKRDDDDDEHNSITVVELITPDDDDENQLTHQFHTQGSNGFLLTDDDDDDDDDVDNKKPIHGEKMKNGVVSRRDGVDSVQPDVIPTDDVVEESRETIQGPPEVEVDAGNHTVTFRSPEIHPVSPRIQPKTRKSIAIKDRLAGCCWKSKGGAAIDAETNAANNNKKEESKNLKGANRAAAETSSKWYSKLCRWKKEPPPPRLSRPMKAKAGTTILSKLNCCKNKRKPKPLKPLKPQAPQSNGQSFWRKIFNKAICAKCCCRKTQPQPPIRPPGTSRLEMKRSSSVPVPTKPTGLPKLDAALVEHTSMMKGAIPVLPICLAWMCLIFNIVLPGIGTVVSGFLCICFGKPRFSVNDSWPARMGSLCLNFVVGISQTFTILFCLVGWGWSIWWGVIMVKIARKNRRIRMAEKAAAATGHLNYNQNHDVEKGNGENGPEGKRGS